MSRIFVTGDIHGNPYNRFDFALELNSNLTKDDYVIILGDFGIVWKDGEEDSGSAKKLDYLEQCPWTTLFVDGNHENHIKLNEYPTKEWKGGQVHELRPSVLHLKRGEVFNIDGKKFFAMGGAASHDIQHGIIDPADYATREEMYQACRDLEAKHGGWRFTMYRIKNETWWEEEVPSATERANALKNLAKNDFTVDYVLSHEMPASVVVMLMRGYTPDEYSVWLETEVRQKINYTKWFGGHYHINRDITYNETILYDGIMELVNR